MNSQVWCIYTNRSKTLPLEFWGLAGFQTCILRHFVRTCNAHSPPVLPSNLYQNRTSEPLYNEKIWATYEEPNNIANKWIWRQKNSPYTFNIVVQTEGEQPSHQPCKCKYKPKMVHQMAIVCRGILFGSYIKVVISGIYLQTLSNRRNQVFWLSCLFRKWVLSPPFQHF